MVKGEIIVIKIGSNLLADEQGYVDLNNLRQLVNQVSVIHHTGKKVVLVSSGAIACGREKLGLHRPIRAIEEKQAAAAVGQSILMREYSRFFESNSLVVSQILLTADALKRADQKENIKNTLTTLLKMNIIPIVNENDTVATDEIRFGDNDSLSAQVAKLIKAHKFVIASDIAGLYNKNPHKYSDACLVKEISIRDKSLKNMADQSTSKYGSGGMSSKITAVSDYITATGNCAYIVNGREKDSITDLVIKKIKNGTKFSK